MAMRSTFLLAMIGLACVKTFPQEKMRAAVISSRSWDFKFHLEKVEVIDVDLPKPGYGEVLVQVYSSSINPVDHKSVQTGILWSYPHKLGSDLAGVVRALGPGCQRLKVGDKVWGLATTWDEVISQGRTFAQYAAISESVLGRKPKSLSMREAGAMPMVSLTGYEALTWAAGGQRFKGDDVTVLVLGGSGGTGHMGIQLAKAMGAKRVITTCSSSHIAFVQSLGADQVIDYHKENFNEVLAPKSVDLVYDCVGLSGTGHNATKILKEHGSFVTLLQSGLGGISSRIHRPDIRWNAPECVGACSQYDRIDQIAALVEAGKLKVHIDTTYGLEDIKQAFSESLAGHTTGKVGLQIVRKGTSRAIVM